VLVWISVGLQLVFLQPLKSTEIAHGMALFVFLVWVGFFWGVTFSVLLFDCVQVYRGKLPRPFLWLRTSPSAAAVLLTPAVLFLVPVC
jgi:hypothetical protein